MTRVYEYACLLAGCEEILEKKLFFLARHQCLISSSHLQGLFHCCLYCWILEMMIQMTGLPLNRRCLLLKLLIVCHAIFFFCKFFVSVNIIYFYLKYFHFHYMTHHSVSKTALSFSCLQNVMVCYTVTMEKVQIIVSDGMRVNHCQKCIWFN